MFPQRRNYHMDDGPEQEERDRIMRAYSGKDPDAKGFHSKW